MCASGTHLAAVAQIRARAKIGEAHVAVACEKDIVGLDVAVDVPEGVHGSDGLHQLCHVEACRVLVERPAHARQQREQIPAGVILHHQVKKRRVLEAIVQRRQVLAVLVQQDAPLLPKARRLASPLTSTHNQCTRGAPASAWA
jgi:hypothetical protein